MRRRWFWLPLTPLVAAYVYLAFTFPQPDVRIVLRTVPVLPFAVWAIFLDPRRPLRASTPGVRVVGRGLLLLLCMAFALLVLGLGLNWVFDPGRIA